MQDGGTHQQILLGIAEEEILREVSHEDRTQADGVVVWSILTGRVVGDPFILWVFGTEEEEADLEEDFGKLLDGLFVSSALGGGDDVANDLDYIIVLDPVSIVLGLF